MSNENSGMTLRVRLGVAIALGLVSLAATSQAATYAFTDLNPDGHLYSLGYAISGSQQVGSGYVQGDSGYHALVWSGTASGYIDLHPGAGFYWSVATGVSGSEQVGTGSGPVIGNEEHALLWTGSANSVVDLNPVGFYWTQAYGVCRGQQVGYGSGPAAGGNIHALLWAGTPGSVVDLNPPGSGVSFAAATSGDQQVGSAYGFTPHAVLWSGSAQSVVHLHPPGLEASVALGISGRQQVGSGWQSYSFNSPGHALLWSGTADSVVDLNPSGFTGSYGLGISGNQQVGVGDGHALLWSGTASSVVDLHSFLSSDYSDSQAESIDTNGNIVGWATYIPTGQAHAILWRILYQPVLLCNDPGQCGAICTYPVGSNTTCIPAPGSFLPVGTNTVTCTTTNPLGIPTTTNTFTITVKDCEPPVASCQPMHKASQQKSGKSDKRSDREEDWDGLYQLLGHDNCDSDPRLYIQDSASPFIAGPFANGDIVRITKKSAHKDSDDSKDSKNTRPKVVAQIKLKGNALVYAVDASGNVGASVLCSPPHTRSD